MDILKKFFGFFLKKRKHIYILIAAHAIGFAIVGVRNANKVEARYEREREEKILSGRSDEPEVKAYYLRDTFKEIFHSFTFQFFRTKTN